MIRSRCWLFLLLTDDSGDADHGASPSRDGARITLNSGQLTTEMLRHITSLAGNNQVHTSSLGGNNIILKYFLATIIMVINCESVATKVQN